MPWKPGKQKRTMPKKVPGRPLVEKPAPTPAQESDRETTACEHEIRYVWSGYKNVKSTDGNVSKPLATLGWCERCERIVEIPR